MNDKGFRIFMPNKDAAEFWLEHFQTQWAKTRDGAFRDEANSLEAYIAKWWPDREED